MTEERKLRSEEDIRFALTFMEYTRGQAKIPNVKIILDQTINALKWTLGGKDPVLDYALDRKTSIKDEVEAWKNSQKKS